MIEKIGVGVMRRMLSLLLAGAASIACAQCHFAAKGKARVVTYRFQPEVTTDGLVMHVVLGFRASGSGVDTLIVPTTWAGETLHAVTNLRAVSKGATLEDGADAETKTVHAAAGRPVVVAYDLKKDWSGRLVHPLQFHPVLMPTYFEFTGSNALVRLRLEDGATERANFDWEELPTAWTLATSFGTSEATTGRCQTFTGSWESVDDGLYAGGDYRILHFNIGSKPAVLAVRGDWTFTDGEASAQIAKVVGTVRAFWHDDNFPYFLVSLKPYDQEHGSSDGSAFTNAFWMYVSNKDSLGPLLPQLAHESFHAWNPMKMGRVPGSDAADAAIRWFREGPTDYYGHLLTYQAGESTAQSYVDWLNEDLRKFSTSDSEYVRGSVIALWLDGTIRRESNGQYSLDNVMFDMVRDAAQPYTPERILATIGHYLSPASRAMLQHAVSDHADLPVPERLPAVDICAHPSLKELPTFDPGLDLTQSHARGVITGVVAEGPAYAAGLRDGQKLLGISVDNGDPEHLAKFKVRTEAGDQWLSFYPRGKTVKAWQYQLDEDRPCEGLL
jgi:predicted metalloprotease with PDZ domain